jgi:hypothetical protein
MPATNKTTVVILSEAKDLLFPSAARIPDLVAPASCRLLGFLSPVAAGL